MADKDYTKIDEPYNALLERNNTPFGNIGNVGGGGLAGSVAVNDPADINPGSVIGQAFNDLTIANWIKARNYTPKKSGFYIDGRTGYAEFVNVYISGEIAATTGTIGGFDIGSDYIRDAANSMGMVSTVTSGDDVRFWAGDTYANRATAPFRVTEAGALAIGTLTWTKFTMFSNFESLDGWQKNGTGTFAIALGQAQMTTLASDTMEMFASLGGGPVVNFTKNPVFQSLVTIAQTTSQIAWFCLGSGRTALTDSFGFHVVNNTLTAFTQDSSGITETTVSATLTDFNIYRAEMTSGTNVKFYLNGTLVATHIANLPTATGGTVGPYYYIEATAAATKNMKISNLIYVRDI